LNYEQIGAGIAEDWVHGRSSTWLASEGQDPNQPLLIILTIACFYTLTLGVRALPLLIMFYSAITAFVPVLVYRIGREIGTTPRAAAAGAWIVAFSPAFAFWSAALYKEGLILVALTLAVYHALRLQSAWRPYSLLVLGVSLLGLAFLRLYVATIAALVLCLGMLVARGRRRRPLAHVSLLLRQVAITTLLAVAVLGIGLFAQIEELVPESVDYMFQQIEVTRYDLAASAESGYLAEADIAAPSDALRFLPLGLAYFLSVPHPWHARGLRQILAIPDTTVWVLAIYPLAWLGMIRTMRRNFPAAILIVGITLAVCGWYGLVIANVGAAYRMRVQVWVLWAVFAGIGWERFRGRPAFERPYAWHSQSKVAGTLG